MKKRIIAGMLSAALFLVNVPLSAFAASGIVLEAKHVKAECKAGTEISVPVDATLNAGYGAGTVDIRWDKTALKLKSVKYTDIAPDNSSAAPTDKGSYRACFGNYLSKENYTATGTFFTMTFTVTATAKPGDYAIIMDQPAVFDAKIKPITASVKAGSISLSGDTPADGLRMEVGKAEAAAGESSEIKVPVQAVKNSGFAAGSVDLLWDPDVLTLSKVEFSELAPDNNSAEIISDGNYRIAFGSFLSTKDTTKTGTLFTLVFKADKDAAAGSYPIVLGNYSVLNAKAERIPVTVRSGAVTLKEKTTTTVTTSTTTKPTTTVTTSTTTKPTTTVTTSTTTKPTTTVTTSTTTKPTTTVTTSTTTKPTTTVTTSTTTVTTSTTTVTTSTTPKPTTTVTTSTTPKPTTTVTTSTTTKPTTTVTTSTTTTPTTTVTTSTTPKPTTTVTTSTTPKPTTTVTTSTTPKPTTTVTTSTTTKPTTTVTSSTTTKPTTTVTTSTTPKPTTTVTTSTTTKPTTTITTSTTEKPTTTVTTSTTEKPTTTVTTSTTEKPTTTVTTSTTEKLTSTDSTSASVTETTSTTTETQPTQPDFLLGDVNDDGTVSVEDAQLTLIEYVSTMSGLDAGFTEKQKLAGDINADKLISVDDAQNILIYYVSNTLSGQALTWDELLGNNAPAKTLPQAIALLFHPTAYHRKNA